jgi:Na+/H+-dicarboxylate symporter
MRSPTFYLMLSVVLGALIGLIMPHSGELGPSLLSLVQVLGHLWLNGLKMTLVPLVFSFMVTGTAGLFSHQNGGALMLTAIILFEIILLLSSFGGAGLAYILSDYWHPHIITLTADMAAKPPAAQLSWADQIIGFIPANPIASAAETQMGPLVIFAGIFGIALSKIDPARREQILSLLQGLADIMLVIINFVISLAPIGVFALIFETTYTLGIDAFINLFEFVALITLVLLAGLSFALVIGMASAGPRKFLAAAIPPLALAISTQSSLACMPAIIKSAREDLEIPESIAQAIIPLASSIFRLGNVCGAVAIGIFMAKLVGVSPTAPQILLACIVGVVTNIGVVGLPGQAIIFAAYGPTFATLGVPLESLALLIAVFTIPDMADTSANVTGNLAVNALVTRISKLPYYQARAAAV